MAMSLILVLFMIIMIVLTFVLLLYSYFLIAGVLFILMVGTFLYHLFKKRSKDELGAEKKSFSLKQASTPSLE